MAHVSESIRVDCPVNEAYNQWTQFVEFPRFMDGIERVDQTDDTHLHWVAKIAGRRAEWDAEITEQVPDKVIAWKATKGATNSGRVQFQGDNDQTEISLEMEVEPSGTLERAADMMVLSAATGARGSGSVQAVDRVARPSVGVVAREGQRRRDAVVRGWAVRLGAVTPGRTAAGGKHHIFQRSRDACCAHNLVACLTAGRARA
jgi:hypothetical protein